MESVLPNSFRKSHDSLSPTTKKKLYAGLEDLHGDPAADWSTAAIPMSDDNDSQRAPNALS
jgi:hypothetical protein